jgi:hypothetical protein
MADIVPSTQGALGSDAPSSKPAFEEPRLTFIEPKLTPCGDLRDVTAQIGGFFCSVDPTAPGCL